MTPRAGLAIAISGAVACQGHAHDDARLAPKATLDATSSAVDFEGPLDDAGVPRGWTTNAAGTVAGDDQVVHGGHRAMRITRAADSPESFSSLSRHDPLSAAGTTIELRGYLRTKDVHGFAGLWLREDGDRPALAFDNMQKRALAGTTDWTAYSISLPLDSNATDLMWGVLLAGDGQVWADDLEVLVDGKPIAQAPPAQRATTALDRDHQFDHGSGIAIARPTAPQIANLVLLGKVWGFLKYHHPAITAGQRHWDYELLRVVPTILAAPDRAAAETALVHWIDGLGAVAPCKTCAQLADKGLALRPDLAWIDDRREVGPELARTLHAIHAARVPDQQFFVALELGVGNPEFRHEPSYADIKLPDAGFQLLALFRLWNVVQYWAPDRALADDWNRVLGDLVPEVLAAATPEAYRRAIVTAIVHMRDGHAFAGGEHGVIPPEGACSLPIDVRFLGRRPIVTAAADELAVGDEITELDGIAIGALIARWAPSYPASNEGARLRDIAGAMTRGACGKVDLAVRRGDRALHVAATRVTGEHHRVYTHDLDGDTFKLLSKDVAYLKLSSVKSADVAGYIERAAGTKGLVVDIRNYPSEFVVFALGSLLVTKPTPFAQFTSGDLSNPGAFHFGDSVELEPAQPHYAGKVVVLVDELSQSQAEYTAMALRAAPSTKVVGSITAGADGNISKIWLPGGMATALSGLGVFYPDRRPTQQVGILPDVTVTPTVAGLRAGRDEVLDAAVRLIR